MAALCGLEEPYAFAAGNACGIGGVPTSDAPPWTLDPDQGTGRTTRIILLALLAVEAGHRVRFTAPTLRNSTWITKRAREYVEKAGMLRERWSKTEQQMRPLRYGVHRMILAPISGQRLEQAMQGAHGDPLIFRDHGYQRTLVRP